MKMCASVFVHVLCTITLYNTAKHQHFLHLVCIEMESEQEQEKHHQMRRRQQRRRRGNFLPFNCCVRATSIQKEEKKTVSALYNYGFGIGVDGQEMLYYVFDIPWCERDPECTFVCIHCTSINISATNCFYNFLYSIFFSVTSMKCVLKNWMCW